MFIGQLGDIYATFKHMKTARLIYGSTLPEGQYYNTDLRWLVGIVLPDPHFLLALSGKQHPTLFASSLEYMRAEREVLNCEVRSMENFVAEQKASSFLEALKVFLKKKEITSLVLHPESPVSLQQKLQKLGVKTEVGREPWFPARTQKTEKEIGEIKKATKSVEEVLGLIRKRLLRASIKNGFVVEHERSLTSEILRRWIEEELYRRGLQASGTIVSSGEATSRPHDLGSGLIRAYVPIVFDIFPHSRLSGYYTDMTRTFFKGAPPKEIQYAYNSVLGAQKAGIVLARAGVDSSKVHNRVAGHLKKQGHKTDFIKGYGFTHSTGHGVGLRVHEDPRVSVKGERLKESSVITIEPGLYYPENGWGIRIEDLGVLTKSGLKLFSSFPKGLVSAIIK